MDIEKRLKAEQHGKLKELQEKLNDVLDHEPLDSGNADEDNIGGRSMTSKMGWMIFSIANMARPVKVAYRNW